MLPQRTLPLLANSLTRTAESRNLAAPNFAAIADQQGPAVVNIRVTGIGQNRVEMTNAHVVADADEVIVKRLIPKTCPH